MESSKTTSIAVNEFVLLNWENYTPDEARKLAKWAASENYQFRSIENQLILENPTNNKHGVVIREKKPTGEVKYYLKVEERGKLRKKSFTMEFEAFLMRWIPLIDKLLPIDFQNTKIKALEDGT